MKEVYHQCMKDIGLQLKLEIVSWQTYQKLFPGIKNVRLVRGKGGVSGGISAETVNKNDDPVTRITLPG